VANLRRVKRLDAKCYGAGRLIAVAVDGTPTHSLFFGHFDVLPHQAKAPKRESSLILPETEGTAFTSRKKDL
jgi:hypothetical protein